MKIVTAVVNNPDFIEIQYYTLKQYYQGTYEFIVFNDAKPFSDYTNNGDITLRTQIEDRCRSLGIQCINIPNDHHVYLDNASERTGEAMNFILRYQIDHPDQYLVIDSDMFLIRRFSALDRYDGYAAAIVLQSRKDPTYHYPWNGLYYFDMLKLNNPQQIRWNRVPGYCDTGGHATEWFLQQMGDRPIPNTDTIRWTNETFHNDIFYFIKHLWSCSWDESETPTQIKQNHQLFDFLQTDPRNQNGKFFCELYDGAFLHYRAGGNWRQEGIEFHRKLTQRLKDVLIQKA
jgi:hypothetical protein